MQKGYYSNSLLYIYVTVTMVHALKAAPSPRITRIKSILSNSPRKEKALLAGSKSCDQLPCHIQWQPHYVKGIIFLFNAFQ